MNMRLAQNEPYPDLPFVPEMLPINWRRRTHARIRPTQRAIGIANLRPNRAWPQLQTTTALIRAADERFARPAFASRRSMSFKVLHRALVVHGLLPGGERAEISAFAGSLPLLA
jgi:hypothetical protein